jgi:hypothetical protein
MTVITNKDEEYLQKIKDIDFQPVFILGYHRSGTSILYKILTETNSFNSVTAYHIIKYYELLYNHENNKEEMVKKELTKYLAESGSAKRKIDKMKVTADFAEEYGFLLNNQTFEMYLKNQNINLFKEMGQKIQYISHNNKPLLLKNPYDFPNFIYIKQKIPNAKFIFIHRHPFKTISSTMKAMKVLNDERNSYTSLLSKKYNQVYDNPLLLYYVRTSLGLLAPLATMQFILYATKVSKYYLKNIQKIPEKDYVIIKYGDLCQNPKENIERIMDYLNISPEKQLDYESLIKPRATSLHPDVDRLRKFIYTRMKKYFTNFGFTPENYKEIDEKN